MLTRRPLSWTGAIPVCLFLLAGCGIDNEAAVRSTVEAFVNADSGSAACDLLHPAYRSEVENSAASGECSDAVGEFGAGDESAEIGEVEIQGNHASVQVEGASGIDDLGYKGEFQLLGADDGWQIIDLSVHTIG